MTYYNSPETENHSQRSRIQTNQIPIMITGLETNYCNMESLHNKTKSRKTNKELIGEDQYGRTLEKCDFYLGYALFEMTILIDVLRTKMSIY